MVRQAISVGDHQPRSGGFRLDHAGSMRWIAPVMGVYLAYVVARVPEVFPVLAIPKFPMVSLIVFTILLAVAVPPAGWQSMWRSSFALRAVAYLFALAWITVPLGIWISGSLLSVSQRYSIAVITFLACLVFLRDRRSLRSAIRIFVLFVVALAIYGIATFDAEALRLAIADESGIDPSLVPIGRIRQTLSASLDPNDWGAVLVVSIPLAVWLAATARAWKPFWYAAALALVGAVVPTQSRGALLGLVAVALVIIGFGAHGWKRLLLIPLLLGAGVIFVKSGGDGGLDRITTFSSDDYNLTNEGRWFFWTQGTVWMLKRPWGYGIENYGTYFGWLNGKERAAHSSWIQYGVELGVLGLALFVGLTATLGRGLAAYRRRMRVTSPVESRTAGLFLAMLAGMLVTGSFLSYAYYPLMYMVLGMAAAVLMGNPWRPVGADLLLRRTHLDGAGSPTPSAAAATTAQRRQPTRLHRPATRR
jgi:O-antigen ligase